MGMSQIGREHRQALFNIKAGLVPMEKGGHGKSVPQVMEAWTEAIPDFSQTDLAREFDEGPADHAVGQRCALVGQEKAGREMPGIKFIPPMEIPLELFHGGRMQRNQAGLAELGQPNGQESLFEINVSVIEAKDFTDSHPGHGHQAKEAIIGPGSQAC
jgi:hypothetical protein